MIATNLKVIAVTLGTILFYTFLANAIPQVESDVPEELALGADVSPEEVAMAGEEIYLGAGGCTACHGTGTRAPNLTTAEPGGGLIGERCADRVPGQSCKEYLHESLVNPNAFLVEEFQPIMPDVSRTLPPAQVWALVAYLESLGGEITVTAADLEAAGGADAAPAASGAVAGGTPSMEPVTILRETQCLVCHQLGDEGAPIGPAFTDIGATRDANSIRESILDPNAEIAPGYEAVGGTMPTNFGDQLTAAQLEAVVQYLATQR